MIHELGSNQSSRQKGALRSDMKDFYTPKGVETRKQRARRQ